MRSYLSLLLALCLPCLLQGQSFPRPGYYRNLVFEGGGIRGIAYGGALAELEDRGMLDSIIRVGGTSAGAIQAMLLSLGYRAQEISDITYCTPIRKFNDGRMFFIGGINRTMNQFGWYRGEKIRRWLGGLIEAKTGNADITFRQHHTMVVERRSGFRDLYVTGTNLSKQRMEVFSWETYPDMKIRDAVRISSSIPLYFRAVLLDSTGRTYRRCSDNCPADVMVDGGIIGDFPIHIFDDRRYQFPDSARGPRFNPQTLGLRIDSDDQIEADRTGNGLVSFQIREFRDYINAFYYIVLENLNRHQLTAADWERTISVSDGGLAPRIRKVSQEEKDMLMAGGRKAVSRFLER